MSKFVFSKDSYFLLYGAASCGTILCNQLLNQGYMVEGFIDQRADEISDLNGIKVYNLNDAGNRFDGEECIVIISVKNVFEHSKIAADLENAGFHNIIYKPYTVLKGRGTEEEKQLSISYDKLMVGEELELNCQLSCTSTVAVYVPDKQGYILNEIEGEIVVSLPLVCLFENIEENTYSQERNALYFFPHIQFFRYLQGEENADTSYYMQYCQSAAEGLGSFEITEAWKQNVVKNRAEICNEMNNAFYFERNFFVENAPRVTWNDKGYFNLNSGKHRTAFWASKKLMFMPVKMSRKDADIWLNSSCAERVLNLLNLKKYFELRAPIEHPYFYQYSCRASLFFYGLVFKLSEVISKIYYSSPVQNYVDEKNIYCSVDDWGFMSRCLRRSGAYVYEEKSMDDELIGLLDELSCLNHRNRIEKQTSYDIAIVQTEDINKMSAIKASHYFYIIPERLLSQDDSKGCIYKGFFMNDKMSVVYRSEENV